MFKNNRQCKKARLQRANVFSEELSLLEQNYLYYIQFKICD